VAPPPVSPGTRFGAALSNATKRPSVLIEGCREAPAAVSEGRWPAGGREMSLRVEDSSVRSSSASRKGRRGGRRGGGGGGAGGGGGGRGGPGPAGGAGGGARKAFGTWRALGRGSGITTRRRADQGSIGAAGGRPGRSPTGAPACNVFVRSAENLTDNSALP